MFNSSLLESSGHWYYYNSINSLSQWEHPVDVKFRRKVKEERERILGKSDDLSIYLTILHKDHMMYWH